MFTVLFSVALAMADEPATAPATLPATAPTLPAESPKQMLKSYNAAMRAGDMDAIEKIFHATTEDEQRAARAMARSEVQVGRMLVAAQEKFGPDGVARIQKAFRDNSDADIEAAQFTIESDRATLRFAGGFSQRFIIRDGRWRVSVAESLRNDGITAEQMIDSVSRRGNFAKVLGQDIASGQLKSVEQVIARIEQRDGASSDDPPN